MAAAWLLRAAERGQAEGQLMLGILFYYGQGVPQSHVQAYAWCELAQINGQRRRHPLPRCSTRIDPQCRSREGLSPGGRAARPGNVSADRAMVPVPRPCPKACHKTRFRASKNLVAPDAPVGFNLIQNGGWAAAQSRFRAAAFRGGYGRIFEMPTRDLITADQGRRRDDAGHACAAFGPWMLQMPPGTPPLCSSIAGRRNRCPRSGISSPEMGRCAPSTRTRRWCSRTGHATQ